jgi:GAF domain-containing protein
MNARPPAPSAPVVAVLDAIARAGLHALPAATSVSVMLVNDDGARTVAASSSWADALEQVQLDTGSGPCLDAALSGETLAMTDASAETRWPAYAAAAMTHGAGSSLSVPIPVDDHGLVGSVNAFAVGTNVFAAGDLRALARLAGAAAASLTTAHASGAAAGARALVDQAKGIVMAADHCTPLQAFDSLRRTADASGQSLREVAAGVVRATTTT